MSILLLGGSSEATQLAKALGPQAQLSLAGVTKKPVATPHRTGGFGGVEGLLQYLSAENIVAIIDATHPFAAQMSRHAAAAAAQTGLPLLRLERPSWPLTASWRMAADLASAAAALPAGARAFLTVGSRSLTPFLARTDFWCLTRAIEPPRQCPPGQLLIQRPPFTLEGEIALLKTHKISHLVSKNAGGAATSAKLEAARLLGVEVIMVQRPPLPAAPTVDSIAGAVTWVAQIKGKT